MCVHLVLISVWVYSAQGLVLVLSVGMSVHITAGNYPRDVLHKDNQK